jgi:hypothetical protein
VFVIINTDELRKEDHGALVATCIAIEKESMKCRVYAIGCRPCPSIRGISSKVFQYIQPPQTHSGFIESYIMFYCAVAIQHFITSQMALSSGGVDPGAQDVVILTVTGSQTIRSDICTSLRRVGVMSLECADAHQAFSICSDEVSSCLKKEGYPETAERSSVSSTTRLRDLVSSTRHYRAHTSDILGDRREKSQGPFTATESHRKLSIHAGTSVPETPSGVHGYNGAGCLRLMDCESVVGAMRDQVQSQIIEAKGKIVTGQTMRVRRLSTCFTSESLGGASTLPLPQDTKDEPLQSSELIFLVVNTDEEVCPDEEGFTLDALEKANPHNVTQLPDLYTAIKNTFPQLRTVGCKDPPAHIIHLPLCNHYKCEENTCDTNVRMIFRAGCVLFESMIIGHFRGTTIPITKVVVISKQAIIGSILVSCFALRHIECLYFPSTYAAIVHFEKNQ